MATWQEIGQDNFQAAVELYDGGRYRSAISRFYYAAFSVLTHELLRRKAGADFKDERPTPGHTQLAGLVEKHLTHMSPERLLNLVRYVRSLYRDRIAADYFLLRVDKQASTKSFRSAEKIFQYLGVTHERR